MRGRKILLCGILAVEGFLLLRPEGTLVRAARGRRPSESHKADYWWRNSPVHMGCSIGSCDRPATRTASYRVDGPRGSTWRVYGFCDQHVPPRQSAGLVYRPGRRTSFDYEVPLQPIWAVYFLLGMVALGLWCAGMWRLAAAAVTAPLWVGFLLLHTGVLAGLYWY